ncbi:MAG: peptidoglycan bridge formation glycyltransferase FemA/FemB family protein [bacterium]|nr:peptidoglycan bridge formation glycyltransferase FemA/FemB family protein [bacterium]
MIDIYPIHHREQWDAFLRECAPHTFLHSWEWSDFNERMGHSVFRLGIFEGEILVGIALILKIQARRGSFLFCPQGPIIRTQLSVHSSQHALKNLVSYLKALALKEKCHFIRMSPLMENTETNRNIFRDLGFRSAPIHMHPEIAWILDITKSEEDLLKDMRKVTRYSIRKAEKDGVTITQSSDISDVEKFYHVYQTTVDRQHFTPFSRGYFTKEMSCFQKGDAVRYFFAEYEGEIIATAMILFDHSSGYYHHGASTLKYPKIPASYLLQWEAIREAKRRGCTLYNFWGVAPEEKQNHPWAGLSLFKKGFGGNAEHYVPAQDLPLHPFYWFSFGVETLRRLKRGL